MKPVHPPRLVERQIQKEGESGDGREEEATGDAPTVPASLRIQAFATGFMHPRTVYTLPNGDVLGGGSTGLLPYCVSGGATASLQAESARRPQCQTAVRVPVMRLPPGAPAPARPLTNPAR